MVIDQGAQPCARKGCTCEVPAGQTYCGPHCANASTESIPKIDETRCACGHDRCSVEAVSHETRSAAPI